jgi:hypothetical protein
LKHYSKNSNDEIFVWDRNEKRAVLIFQTKKTGSPDLYLRKSPLVAKCHEFSNKLISDFVEENELVACSHSFLSESILSISKWRSIGHTGDVQSVF